MERNSKSSKVNVLSLLTWTSNLQIFFSKNFFSDQGATHQPKKNALSKRDAVNFEEKEDTKPREKKELSSLGRLNFVAEGKSKSETKTEEAEIQAPKPKSNADFKNLFKKK